MGADLAVTRHGRACWNTFTLTGIVARLSLREVKRRSNDRFGWAFPRNAKTP
jgi:hypothetical protein